MEYFKCKQCGKEINGKDLGRGLNLAMSLNEICNECEESLN